MVWPSVDVEPGPQARVHFAAPKSPPHGKQIELEIVWFLVPGMYQIKECTNYNGYHPGEWLTQDAVDQINDTLPDWKVHTVGFQWLKVIAAFAGAARGIV